MDIHGTSRITSKIFYQLYGKHGRMEGNKTTRSKRTKRNNKPADTVTETRATISITWFRSAMAEESRRGN